MSSLRVEGIAKIFAGGTVALSGVDLEVAAGEMVVLLGPSGCGKSTLLRIIAGIETPSRGHVYIDDKDVTERPPRDRDIAMVFQNYALYPHMTVRENLGFGLKMRGTPREEITRRVGEVADSLGIQPLLDRRPAQLSGGQRQRVALGRAIAREAKVFLLDEPLSNLDVQLRVATRMELARLHRDLNVPMVYVTHDQEEAMTLGDRVMVMRAGEVLQIGTPIDIYTHPATQFVGAFVGSPRMNLVPARLVETAGGLKLEMFGVTLELRERRGVESGETPHRQDGRMPRDVIVGIRPEHLELAAEDGADFMAGIDVVEQLGRESLLHVLVDSRADGPAAEMRVLVSGLRHLAPGERIGLRLRREVLHFFDPKTEKRLT
jgi:multiple sugar transport system ATP-binding protein